MQLEFRAVRVMIVAGGGALFLLAAAGLTAWLGLRASLPRIDGHATLTGLDAQLVIERDAAGVPTIMAGNRHDLARGLGYVHGQDRFFQMDLLRRAAAGELSALLGPSVLEVDRQLRAHRFRHVAHDVVARLDAQQLTVLNAYVAGVNAGLSSLSARPFEYWLLRAHPKPWTAEDTILCIDAMYLQLQDGQGQRQLQRGLLRSELPESAWRFLEAGAPEWSAAVDGTTDAEPRLPLATEYDLRSREDLPVLPPERLLLRLGSLGSNNWAVAGTHTANGAAIVANDMHLGFRVPNIWYRARLIQSGPDGSLDLTGVTLPGTPTTVAGSNGAVAWGFTNSYGQFSAVIRLAPVAGDATAYSTAAGPKKFSIVDEAIEVAGAPTEHLRISMTEWGPVLGSDWEGRPYAFQWAPQDAAATNLDLLKLEHAGSVGEALRMAAGFGIPGQNFMVADKQGSIGWTIAGRLPLRAPGDSGIPQKSTEAAVGFNGWLDPELQPKIVDPVDGFLWTANTRAVGGPAAALIGDDGMDRGARAAQIHDDLQKTPAPFTPASSLAIELDDRAVFLERWRALLLQVITASRAGASLEHQAAFDTLRRWSGHAATADAAYRLVNLFREQVEARVFFMLIAPARARAPAFQFVIPSSFEGPLWRVLQRRPLHLLAARYAGWNSLLLEALGASEVLPSKCSTLPSCDWGRVNAVHIAHPLSGAIPLLSRWLDMPTVSVPGGREDMPRIQGADYGASERFSVAPGFEAEGFFHMPGAQSGHPLSPFYRAGFENWVHAARTPFLPGPGLHRLILAP